MRSLLCLLRRYLDAFSARDAEHTCNQFGGPRAFVVGGNGVHDDARVDIGVDNSDSGNMLNGAFADSVKVGYGIKEYDKVRNHALGHGHLGSEEMDLICEGARKPLLAEVVSLWAYALGSLEDGGAEVGTGAYKDDGPVSRCDGSDKSSCATKMGKCALEVYDSNIRACSIRIWDEIRVEQGSVMTEVRSGGEKSRKCQVAWGRWAMQGMMRLPCIVPSLC
jgi:hypothetical protein